MNLNKVKYLPPREGKFCVLLFMYFSQSLSSLGRVNYVSPCQSRAGKLAEFLCENICIVKQRALSEGKVG